jgi:hypothetical protein
VDATLAKLAGVTMALKHNEYLPWFDEILQRFNSIKQIHVRSSVGTITYHDAADAHDWLAEAGSAIGSVFAPSDVTRQMWESLHEKMLGQRFHNGVAPGSLDPMLGVFRSAVRQLREGRITSFIQTIRVETEDELLDQAESLLRANQIVAAVVLAGGALETHLRHLAISKYKLEVAGDGSISKYDAAIAQARKSGSFNVYGPTDSKLVTFWGGVRNDAAHKPGTFSSSDGEVHRMILGIREFISRTT